MTCLEGHITKKTRKPSAAYHFKQLISSVKHGGGGVMIWAGFSATGPGHVRKTSSVYQTEVVCPAAKAWLTSGHRAGQSPQRRQHIYNRTAERRIKVKVQAWVKYCGKKLIEYPQALSKTPCAGYMYIQDALEQRPNKSRKPERTSLSPV